VFDGLRADEERRGDVPVGHARGREFGRPSFGVLDRFVSAGWVKRSSRGRAVTVTDRGRTALADCFGIDWTE
jgi:hypothetical protein